LDGAFFVDDRTQSEASPDGIQGFFLVMRDSTVLNFTALVRHQFLGGNYRRGTADIQMDNVTATNFATMLDRTGVVEWNTFTSVHDSDIFSYNRNNAAQCALQTQTAFITLIKRVHFRPDPALTTGCAAGADVRLAIGNYFEGGFLQIVFGADFGRGTSPNFGSPTEFVNWSRNYANDSRHTVFGVYGSGTGAFGNHLGTNAYITVYQNYVNNSRYIPFQSSGNQTNVREIGNYIRGPFPWPGGSPSFELAFLLGTEDHNSLLDHNYLWDMNDDHISGITIGFSAHDNVISNNVIYDVGSNHIRMEGQILKYQNATACPGPSGCSDYSWKNSNNLVSGNYLAGGTTSARAISVDSGHVVFTGNAVVSAGSGTFLIREGLPCDPNCSFSWVDWIDGWPDSPTISWSGTIPPGDEGRFWVRSMRTGQIRLNLPSPATVYVNETSDPTKFGLLAPRCVWNGAATGGHTTTDAEVFLWSGQSCGPFRDINTTVFSNSGIVTLNEPERWYNKTLTTNLAPTGTAVSGSFVYFSIMEASTFTNVGDGRSWALLPGHSYVLTPGDRVSIAGALASFPFIVFMGVITLMMIGAWSLKKRRGR
jgi:hypothetical protein